MRQPVRSPICFGVGGISHDLYEPVIERHGSSLRHFVSQFDKAPEAGSYYESGQNQRQFVARYSFHMPSQSRGFSPHRLFGSNRLTLPLEARVGKLELLPFPFFLRDREPAQPGETRKDYMKDRSGFCICSANHYLICRKHQPPII